MCVMRRLLGVSQRAQSFNYVVLRIRLARIDHVIDFVHAAKVRMIALAALSRDPALVTIRIEIEAPISKVPAEQSTLPQMVGNVFADVSNRAVGAHNHLIVFFYLFGGGASTALHH